ncbi:FAD-dependent oxidoreductase [Natrinema sp. 74]|uniref:FAD-dependent oxidoreductase n=1 Tax=Natrinema sp. 74 TaxID=3384159 RepID=UPI0038D48C09
MKQTKQTRRTIDIAVIGGGVIGITTAIYLELRGYSTAIYTEKVPFRDELDPEFATPYAAASIKPASVTISDQHRLLAISQDVFGLLAAAGSMGVRQQPHFVLSEEDQSDPEYATTVRGFRRLSEVERYPRRPDARSVFGWRFDAYFAELPVYLSRCYTLYDSLGGTVHKRSLTRDACRDLPGDVLVNCAGLGSRRLFDDPRPWMVHVGHQVLADGLSLVQNESGDLFSYNYVPDPDTIPDGLAGEVYAYPRMDTIVLGGSRIPVSPDEDWDGQILGSSRSVGGVEVPSRIIAINDELLDAYADVAITEGELVGRYGFRPVRDPDGHGVRIERVSRNGRPVVHNCGHGGAGVTLSWGSAAKACELVSDVLDPSPKPLSVSREFAVAERLAARIRSDSYAE